MSEQIMVVDYAATTVGHVGSTGVPGLSAKPDIDINVLSPWTRGIQDDVTGSPHHLYVFCWEARCRGENIGRVEKIARGEVSFGSELICRW
jgi:hypothetical protein